MTFKVKLIIFFTSAFIIILTLFLAFRPSGQKQAGNNFSEQTQVKPGFTVVKAKNTSEQIELRDFNQNPIKQYKETTVIVDNTNFSIVYFPKDQAFLVTLLSQPVRHARDLAEQEFIRNLQLDYGEACKLNVVETVPFEVEPNLSGQIYGLSFCPGTEKF